jgi:hypothetical protein
MAHALLMEVVLSVFHKSNSILLKPNWDLILKIEILQF